RFRGQHLSVLGQCNIADSNPTALAEQVAEIYLEKDLAPKPKPVDEKPTIGADQAQGTYFSRDTLLVLRLAVRDGKLRSGSQELHPAGGSLYRTEAGGQYRFEGSKLVFVPAEGRTLTFER